MRRVSEDDFDRPASPNLRPEAQWTPTFVMAGGSLAVKEEAKRRKRQSVGISVALQALLMGGMMAAVVVGPPVPRLRANPTPVRILTYFVMPPPPVRARRARTQPTPPAATPPPPLWAPRRAPRAENPPTPVRPPASVRERAGDLPARRPESRPAPARPSSAKPPTAGIELGKFGAPPGLDPQPGAVVPVPTIGTFGAALHQDPAPGPSPGAVAAAGFDRADAGADPAANPASVRSGGFGSMVAAGSPAPNVAGEAGRVSLNRFARPTAFPTEGPPVAMTEAPAFVPPQVLSWPQPAYTPEAAQRRIEGEVVLEVRLGADGKVEVERVLQGLGYGLNAAAAAAARQLRFRPAQRHGQAVDWTVQVHMVFKLAY